MGRHTLQDIDDAIKKGAVVTVFDGFHARNIAIAAHPLIALSWSAGGAPTSGGTAHTCRACREPKTHVSLRAFAAEYDARHPDEQPETPRMT